MQLPLIWLLHEVMHCCKVGMEDDENIVAVHLVQQWSWESTVLGVHVLIDAGPADSCRMKRHRCNMEDEKRRPGCDNDSLRPVVADI